jgi:hypothetical protein
MSSQLFLRDCPVFFKLYVTTNLWLFDVLNELHMCTYLHTRFARFFLVQHTKTGNIYQITIKYTKWPPNIPTGRKIDQMAINTKTYSIARRSRIYLNWDLCFENMPSGSPVTYDRLKCLVGYCISVNLRCRKIGLRLLFIVK